jgi:dCTP deaminase
MGLKNDAWIRTQCEGFPEPMISPFVPSLRRDVVNLTTGGLDKIISYGLTSYGYDLRVAGEYMIFTNVNNVVVDPKAFDEKAFVKHEGDYCIIPPNSFALARSVEYLRIPRNVMALCLGKSSYARCGIVCNFTPFEPGWEGHVTIEISNTTPLPAKIYSEEGIAQVMFFEGDDPPEISYADRKGKYQGQRGITPPRV